MGVMSITFGGKYMRVMSVTLGGCHAHVGVMSVTIGGSMERGFYVSNIRWVPCLTLVLCQ